MGYKRICAKESFRPYSWKELTDMLSTNSYSRQNPAMYGRIPYIKKRMFLINPLLVALSNALNSKCRVCNVQAIVSGIVPTDLCLNA